MFKDKSTPSGLTPSKKGPIRVVIVDDQVTIRMFIKRFLSRAKDMSIVGEAANGIEALQLAKTLTPDVLLLDVEIPGIRGDEVAKQLQEMRTNVQILAFSSYEDPKWMDRMLMNGAAGYISKDEVARFLLVAIRAIASKNVYMLPWLSPNAKAQLDHFYLAK